MIQIPEYFVQKTARTFGAEGTRWIEQLPDALAHCTHQWCLSHCVLADRLSINLVCFAESAIHGDVVLKMDGLKPFAPKLGLCSRRSF